MSNGGIASAYVVSACVDASLELEGSGTFIVPADEPGVRRGRSLSKVELRVLIQAPVFLDEVEVPESNLLFPHGESYPMLHNSIVTVGNLAVGYLAAGLMRAAYEHALHHSRDRVQWAALSWSTNTSPRSDSSAIALEKRLRRSRSSS